MSNFKIILCGIFMAVLFPVSVIIFLICAGRHATKNIVVQIINNRIALKASILSGLLSLSIMVILFFILVSQN